METDCQYCKHYHEWSDKEKIDYINRYYEYFKTLPNLNIRRGNCDKIPKGTEWIDEGKVYTYDGYSLYGENYDEVFNCFEKSECEVN